LVPFIFVHYNLSITFHLGKVGLSSNPIPLSKGKSTATCIGTKIDHTIYFVRWRVLNQIRLKRAAKKLLLPFFGVERYSLLNPLQELLLLLRTPQTPYFVLPQIKQSEINYLLKGEDYFFILSYSDTCRWKPPMTSNDVRLR